jgi:hypothetical protein
LAVLLFFAACSRPNTPVPQEATPTYLSASETEGVAYYVAVPEYLGTVAVIGQCLDGGPAETIGNAATTTHEFHKVCTAAGFKFWIISGAGRYCGTAITAKKYRLAQEEWAYTLPVQRDRCSFIVR